MKQSELDKKRLRYINILRAIPTIKRIILEGGRWEEIKSLCEPLGLNDTAFREHPRIDDYLLDEKYWLKELGLEHIQLKEDKIDKAHILYLVNKALGTQFESYSWDDMIKDIDDLTSEEKEWAKNNTGYQAYICE